MWGLHGSAAAAALEAARSSRRPAHRVLFDVRARAGGRTGGGRSGGGARDTYQAGLFGEEVVADQLVADGWRILGHRVRTKVGELDLVARRGDAVVFAEVKTARPGRISVEESIDQRARMRIRRSAVAWMAANPRLQRGVRAYRFDVFIVRRDEAGVVERVDHLPDAF
jgi:putative endonuclease